jgi:hypothetical protein
VLSAFWDRGRGNWRNFSRAISSDAAGIDCAGDGRLRPDALPAAKNALNAIKPRINVPVVLALPIKDEEDVRALQLLTPDSALAMMEYLDAGSQYLCVCFHGFLVTI